MFGRRKKEPTPPPGPLPQEQVGDICIDIIRATGRFLAAREGFNPETFAATLELDHEQRITRVVNPAADGAPFLPTPDLVEQLNGIVAPFRGLPENHRLATLSFTFDHGEVDTHLGYRDS